MAVEAVAGEAGFTAALEAADGVVTDGVLVADAAAISALVHI